MARIEDLNPSVGIGGPVDYAPTRPAQGFARLGQQAEAANALLEDLQNRDAALQGASALADYRIAREKRQVELRTQAKSPDGFVETVTADFDEAAEKFISAHENPRVQAFLEQRLVDVRASEEAEAIGWQANAIQERAELRSLEIIEKNANIVTSSPGKFHAALADVEAAIEAAGLQLPQADRMRAGARKALSRAAVLGQVETNPHGVLKQLNGGAWDEYLDSDVKVSAINAAQSEIKRRASEARARQAMVRQEALFNLDQWEQDNVASIEQTGKAVDPPYTDAEMKSFLSPRQYETMKRDQQQASTLFQAIGNLAQQTPAEMMKTVEALKPEPGQQGYADQLKVYTAAQKLKKKTEDDRRDDPGLAVRMAVPAVRDAWQTFEQSQRPEDLRAALKQTKLAQEALGVPKADQALLTKQFAKNIAGQVNGAKPEEAAKILRSTAETFGAHWPQVFKQMSKDLDANMRVAATIEDPHAAALLVEGSRQPVTALRKAVGVSDKDTGIGQAVASDDRVIALATSLSQRAGGSGTATQVQASIELLALQRMRSFGEDQATATEAAIKRVVGDKYAFGGAGGFGRAASRSYRIPKQAGDPDQINRATLRIQSTLPVQELDLPRDVPGSLKKYTAETYVNAVRREGYWVTNDDESSVILYAGNVPVTVGGKPVERTWSELKQVEVPRVGPKAPKPLRPVWPFTGDGQ